MGAVQVPGDGRPIVLMADRQPTGGYPKIATVIGPDLGALAQMRPGARFRFAAVTIPHAIEARRAQHEALRRQFVFRPVIRTKFSSEFLLGQDLIGSVAGESIS
jgi:allophanate hydrolase subunit 2